MKFQTFGTLLCGLSVVAGLAVGLTAPSGAPMLPSAPILSAKPFVAPEPPPPAGMGSFVAAQEHEVPGGAMCHPPVPHQAPGPATCACHRRCENPDDPCTGVVEDPQCKWYCKPEKCSCPVDCLMHQKGDR